MSYGRMAGGYGAGGPSVDTILSEPNCRPGGVVAGKVHLRGGDRPVEIRHVTLALMPRMQNGYGGETAGPEVYRGALTRGFTLEAGRQRDMAFSIPLPYELPFTTVLGHELPGFTIGMCTEVDAKGQPDPGDVDPISVEPLESQQWVLASIARLGFQISNVTFESSKLRGVSQQLPFHQEIHLAPPPAYQGRLDSVGLSFVASPRSMAFVLRAEERSAPSDESFGVFQVGHAEAAETDWNAKIGRWLEAAAALPRAASSHAPRGAGGAYGGPPPGQAAHGQAPLPPPGGHFPPPPGQPGRQQPAAAYGGPAEYGQPGNAQFPPPAPAPGQSPAPMHTPGHAPPPGPTPGHAPPPGLAPPPGHAPPHGAPPAPGPGFGNAPGYPPAPGHAPSGPGFPPPAAPGHAPMPGAVPPPAPGGAVPYAPPGPPPPAPPGPGAAPYPPAHGHPGPPPVPLHHGPPGHHGYRGHHGRGVAAAGLVGGAAAAGIAGGMAVGAMGDAAIGAAGFAQNVAGYAAGVPVDAFGNAIGGYAGQVAGHVAGQVAGNVAGNVMGDVAGGVVGDVAGDVAGEIAGGVGEILGGLLGGLFG
ncbi:sporulation protein [Actinomadura sp. NEAU-AAG7]|uniref:sporulation protein n=1 Tax=Actinomadura sp. NEAU-AAG7 TaxID=2839640 RepID=UPI001BE4A3D4|nr:sporulation protein [Actinomadura sp. NEAU-AAG7]MBT2213001.1 sporulation protein [Actinomadura sp. NEAU-AAG7]